MSWIRNTERFVGGLWRHIFYNSEGDLRVGMLEWPIERMERAWWYLAHRYVPWHQYHLVNTGMDPGYHDPKERIERTLFTLLVHYVESKGGFQEVQWDCHDEARSAKDKILDAYKWYTFRRPLLERQIEEKWEEAHALGSSPDTFFQDIQDEEKARHRELVADAWELERKLEREKIDKMKLIVEVSPHLWFI